MKVIYYWFEIRNYPFDFRYTLFNNTHSFAGGSLSYSFNKKYVEQ